MTFDSREYEWADIAIVIGGKPVMGVRGVKYAEKQEKEYLYAKGNNPRAIQRKNKSYEGEITVLQSELEALIRSSKAKSILDLRLDNITVAYAPEGGIITTDQMVNVEFTESAKDIKQGDGFQEITLPVMFLRLKHNI